MIIYKKDKEALKEQGRLSKARAKPFPSGRLSQASSAKQPLIGFADAPLVLFKKFIYIFYAC